MFEMASVNSLTRLGGHVKCKSVLNRKREENSMPLALGATTSKFLASAPTAEKRESVSKGEEILVIR